MVLEIIFYFQKENNLHNKFLQLQENIHKIESSLLQINEQINNIDKSNTLDLNDGKSDANALSFEPPKSLAKLCLTRETLKISLQSNKMEKQEVQAEMFKKGLCCSASIPQFWRLIAQMKQDDIKKYVKSDYQGTYYGQYVNIIYDLCKSFGFIACPCLVFSGKNVCQCTFNTILNYFIETPYKMKFDDEFLKLNDKRRDEHFFIQS